MMRKWAVNWGGLKKDHRDSSVASSFHAQDGQDITVYSLPQKAKVKLCRDPGNGGWVQRR
jgi:hypothetical protein